MKRHAHAVRGKPSRERLTEAYEVRAFRDESEAPPETAVAVLEIPHGDPGEFQAAKETVKGHGEQTILRDECQFGEPWPARRPGSGRGSRSRASSSRPGRAPGARTIPGSTARASGTRSSRRRSRRRASSSPASGSSRGRALRRRPRSGLGAGVVGLLVGGLAWRRLAPWGAALATPGTLPVLVTAAFFGTFLGLGLNQAGLTWSDSTGAVSTINSLAPVWLIPLSSVFLGERHGPRAWLSTLLALGGLALLSV